MRRSTLGRSEIQDDYKLFLLSKLTTSVYNLINCPDNQLLHADFCRRIEVLLYFGVKKRTFKWKSEAQDVWTMLKEVSPSHITEDIVLLNTVRTDHGKVRAWIRLTTNESTLHSYLQLVTDEGIVKKYYEGYGLFNDPDTTSKIIGLISKVTERGCKIAFNPESFDNENAPSATDMSQFRESELALTEGSAATLVPSPESELLVGNVSPSTLPSQPSDESFKTVMETRPTSLSVDSAEDEEAADETPTPVVVDGMAVVTVDPKEPSEESPVEFLGRFLPFTESVPLVAEEQQEKDEKEEEKEEREDGEEKKGDEKKEKEKEEQGVKEDRDEKLEITKDMGLVEDEGITEQDGLSGQQETAEEQEITENLGVADKQETAEEQEVTENLGVAERCGIAESISESGEAVPIADEVMVEEQQEDLTVHCTREEAVCTSAPLSSSPEPAVVDSLPARVISSDANVRECSGGFETQAAAAATTGSPTTAALSPAAAVADYPPPPPDMPPQEEKESADLQAGVAEVIPRTVDGLISDSISEGPLPDILPGTAKDSAICEEDVYKLRQSMGNSLQTSEVKQGEEEMFVQRIEESDDPYAEEDEGEEDGSAKSLTPSSQSEPTNENLLQSPEPSIATDVPVGAPLLSSSPRSYEPHSLGSSLYRLFSRGNASTPVPPTDPPRGERLSSLAELHSALTDEIPVSTEEGGAAPSRSYIMSATRATAAYTYESAGQWLSLSKDMWWWLQRRVIKEHECEHPKPPEQPGSGSPNSSSLLELCTENCACCNALVIDYCNKDSADDDAVFHVSRSCPPFSDISKYMQSSSPKNLKPPTNILGSSGSGGNHFSIDILDNPAPTLSELREAIDTQKRRIQETNDDAIKKRETDILVKLRQRQHELLSGSDSSGGSDPTTVGGGGKEERLTVLGHNFVRSTELSGYCGKCNGAVYRRLKAAYLCRACGVILHKACINDISRHCALSNKDALRLITQITPSYGLHQQNYSCFDCGTEISYNSGSKVHLCDYTGRYYCAECHKRTPHSIPGRIIHNWDFKPRSVALQSAEVLAYLEARDYLNLELLNPGIFAGVPVMAELRTLRERVILYKAHFLQCARALREGLCLRLKARQHFIDTSKLYTLQDLKDAQSGVLLPELEGVVAEYEEHYRACSTCTNMRFGCSICTEPPLLAPFSGELVTSLASCPQCHALMHRSCFNGSRTCPHCSSSLLNEN